MSVTHEVPAGTTPVVGIPAPRTPTEDAGPPAPVTPATPSAVEMCRCDHERDAHEHLRPGTDCGICGIACRSFHARTGRGARSAGTRSRLRAAGRSLRRP